MGVADVYPFVLSPEVIRKLAFVHEVVHAGRPQAAATKPAQPQAAGSQSASPQPAAPV